MKSNYKRIGDLIAECDKRNTRDEDLELWGVSIDKKFIKSVANIIGTDLSKYKVIDKDCFVCSLMQVSRDEKIPIARWNKDYSVMVSPAYKVFRVVNSKIVSPEYLDLWFKRAEFDREASFYGVGGVRGSLEWSDFCGMSLPVPEIEEQQKIVNAYNVIERRIAIKRQINDNLESQALAIYMKFFVEEIDEENLPEGWSMGTLKDIYQFQYGKGNTNPDNGGQYPIYGSNGIIGGYHEYNNENGPIIGHIGAAGSLNFAFGKHYVTYNGIMCKVLNPQNIYFGYLTLYSQNLAAQVRGSTQPFISYDMLYEIKTVLPKDDVIASFHYKLSPLMEQKRQIQQEIQKLEQLQAIMQGRLSSELSR